MSEKKKIIVDNEVYEIEGSNVTGWTDRTGAPIEGNIDKISGNRVSGFRDSTGRLIDLKEVK
jgi:hypothetical protein